MMLCRFCSTRLDALNGRPLVAAGRKTSASRFTEGDGSLLSRKQPSELGIIIMAEIQTAAVTPKSKSKPVATIASVFEMPKFEMPKFEMPKFDMPNMEMPAAFREMAEKGVAQAKEGYEKLKTAAENATELLEDTYATASKGYSDYGLKLIETARANSNSAFDLFGEVLSAKSAAEVVELYSTYVRTQFDTVSAQAKELADHAQKVATETIEPIKESFTSAVSKAA